MVPRGRHWAVISRRHERLCLCFACQSRSMTVAFHGSLNRGASTGQPSSPTQQQVAAVGFLGRRDCAAM